MKFGPLPVTQAEGAILAHSVKAGSRTLKKGTVLSASDISDLSHDGLIGTAAKGDCMYRMIASSSNSSRRYRRATAIEVSIGHNNDCFRSESSPFRILLQRITSKAQSLENVRRTRRR